MKIIKLKDIIKSNKIYMTIPKMYDVSKLYKECNCTNLNFFFMETFALKKFLEINPNLYKRVFLYETIKTEKACFLITQLSHQIISKKLKQ